MYDEEKEAKMGTSRCYCECGEYFNSVTAFDMHRITVKKAENDYDDEVRRCLTAEEMLAKGMALNKDGFWIKEPFSDRGKAHYHAETTEAAS